MALDPILLGNRVEDYWIDVLDTDDQVIGRAEHVAKASLSANFDSVIQTTCKIQFESGPDYDWERVRFRPWIRVDAYPYSGSRRVEFPVGVYFPASPENVYDAFGPSRNAAVNRGRRFGKTTTVTLADKTAILDQKKSSRYRSFQAGDNVIEAAELLIEEGGGNNIALTPSSLTFRDDITWPPTTSDLKLVNDCLRSINYRKVFSDSFGWYRANPWTSALDRTPDITLEEGQFSIHTADFSRTQDTAGVPNEAICITSASDNVPALVAVARNMNPDSPYSIPSRNGRVLSRTYENQEASDITVLQAIAERNLQQASHPPSYVETRHAVIPMALNDVVHLISADLDARFWINEWDYDLGVDGGLVKTKLLEDTPT